MSTAPVSDVVPRLHNLFFAIRPPAEKVQEIVDLTMALKIGGTPLRPERLHVSLLALSIDQALPAGLIEEATDVAETIRMSPLHVIFDRVAGGARSAVLLPSEPLGGLRMLRERLGFALIRAGVDVRLDRRFSPHITLLYGGQPMPEIEIDPITWTVDEFVLIDSHIGLTHHETVGRWPLKAK